MKLGHLTWECKTAVEILILKINLLTKECDKIHEFSAKIKLPTFQSTFDGSVKFVINARLLNIMALHPQSNVVDVFTKP